jgi:hypothetical protein
MRPIGLLALTGIATAFICLPLAASLHRWSGAHSPMAAAWDEGRQRWWSDHLDWLEDDGDAADDSGSIETRAFPWADGDRLELDVPAKLHFHPAAHWTLSIRGHARTLERLRIAHGRIGLEHGRHRAADLTIELSGPALREVQLNGAGELALEGIQQDRLHIEIHGSASARASGSVRDLRLDIAGSGNAQLAALLAHSADVHIGGSGDADINCTDSAEVSILGSGDVRLHAHPLHLRSRVLGSGEVIEVQDSHSA